MAITGATLERSACRAIDRPLSKGDDMAFISTSTWKAAAAFKLAAVLAIVALVLFPTDLAAQGQPVQNGPMLPLALWWGGACVLGLVMVYAILRNRDRTRSEKQVTDQATKDLYAEEERDRKRSGSV
jgi:arginine exporter protein ArgO